MISIRRNLLLHSQLGEKRMVRRKGGLSVQSLAFIFGLLTIFCVAYVLFSGEKAAVASFPDPFLLDESSIAAGRAEVDCTIKSPSDITVLGVRTSCGCLWTDGLPLQIPANEPRAVTFVFDPKKRSGDKQGVSFELAVRFIVNGQAQPLECDIRIVPAADL